MLVSSNIAAIVQRLVGLASRTDQRSSHAARQFSVRLKNLLMRALEEGSSKVDINSLIFDELVARYADVGVRGYAQGWLSVDDISLARDKYPKIDVDLDLGNLRDKLETSGGRELKRRLAPVEDAMNAALADIAASGAKLPEARRMLQRKMKALGVSSVSAGYIDTLLRTHGQVAFNAARWIKTQANPRVWGYMYATKEDDRVRVKHEEMHGLVRPKDAKIWLLIWPPNDWNCRCQIVVLYDEQEVKYSDAEDRRNFKNNVGSEFRVNFAEQFAD